MIQKIWNNLCIHQGENFTQKRGDNFSYEVQGNYLLLSRTNFKLSKNDLEKALYFCPLVNTMPVQHLRAPSYIFALLNDKGTGIELSAVDLPFNISIRQHSDNDIDKAMHQEDLAEPEMIYLAINGEVSGVGSGSCGPDVLDTYLTPKKNEYSFRYKIKPIGIRRG